MNGKHHRYPGAQPFGDDEFSRRIFFGRDKASVALTDQILANRLVVVYAKSGSGKTSLLNAGVAPRLRDALHAPLFVRVNDRKRGPLASVFEGIKSECERQKLEFVAGDTSSLWSFFKTVEFWRDDVLLTPVLILDQFEELFTLQSFEEREKFLTELGSLLRGTPPEGHDPAASGISTAPPAIRVVLSLREDFLGLLDEGSDRIPEIMDHRYRLAPLSAEMAGRAITGPAALESEGLATRAFQLKPECVASIVDYLSRSAANREEATSRQVEPFHLQLICQMIESVAAFKQKASAERVILSFADIGGEAALTETLEDFYADAVRSLPRKKRRAARRMCAHLLISVEGRRLSVDERELSRHSRLTREDLRLLQDRRLLRTDRRSDRTYYELGHDALVQPVLASRRTQAMITYTTAIFGGSIIALGMAIIVIALLITLKTSHSADDKVFVPLFGVICAVIGAVGYVWLRAGIRLRTRYAEHDGETSDAPQSRLSRLRKPAGWALLFIGPPICVVYFLVGVFFLTIASTAVIWHGHVPSQLGFLSSGVAEEWPKMQVHPVVNLLWVLLEFAGIVACGGWLYRKGGTLLWRSGKGSRARTTALQALKGTPSLIVPFLRAAGGGVALALGVLGLYTLRSCSSTWHGDVARWLRWPVMTDRLPQVCSTTYTDTLFSGWDGPTLLAFLLAVIVLALAEVWNGSAGIFSMISYRRAAKQKPRIEELLAFAGICLVAILVLSPFAKALWTRDAEVDVWGGGVSFVSHSSAGGSNWETRRIDGTVESLKATSPDTATAVGKDGAIWHTTDGGKSWTPIHWGQGDHKGLDLEGIWFTTPQTGWVAGAKGTLLKTVDGGNSWLEVDQEHGDTFRNAASLLDVWFATPQIGWVATSAGIVLHTTDGGTTWETQTPPKVVLEAGKKPVGVRLFFVAFVNPQCGWLTGAGGNIFYTRNGGQTWTTQIEGTKGNLDGIAAVNCSSAWVVGEKGTILHTDDGGATWKRQNSGVTEGLIEISFIDAQTGWAVGDNGIILHTDDGGQTWFQQRAGMRDNFGAVWAVKR